MAEDSNKIFQDVYSNIIPERVPIDVGLAFEALAQLGGMDIRDLQWSPKMAAEVSKEVCDRLHSDTSPIYGTSRPAAMYKALGSKSFVFSESGVMQHPEVSTLELEDYDYFIEHPYDCMIERAFPRFNTQVDIYGDPVSAMLSYAKALMAKDGEGAEFRNATAPASAGHKYAGRYPGSATAAPFDYLADILRSFSKISVDVRRNRQKIIDACDALLPVLFKMGTPETIGPMSRANYWTHMATFLRGKDFDELWWPGFYTMANNYAAMGMGINAWVEDDWTRYTDYLADLPVNSMIRFEHGDRELYKSKLGHKLILMGLYEFTNLKTHSKEGCIDEVKKLFDVMAPGGRYVFNFDKVLMMIDREEFEKLCALVDFAVEYGKYDNPGGKSGLDYRKEDYTPIPTRIFESKYYIDWSKQPGVSEEAAKKLQSYEDKAFMHMMSFFR
ncbi:MAG: uroporphyrinogen decarboxylase [Firmicutes bacterium]|nr:uroporphyrinogen decarboxylase [Bacillota bacterium]